MIDPGLAEVLGISCRRKISARPAQSKVLSLETRRKFVILVIILAINPVATVFSISTPVKGGLEGRVENA